MLLYGSTIFAGAFLLFLVQPLIGRFILPWFGGSPGVWTVCMLFFQMLLLGGYAWVHLTTRLLPIRIQAGLHLALLAAAALSLPITPDASWKPAGGADPTGRIVLLLAVCIGVAYFALSTTGPLLQRWYSAVKGGAPPYRLFALSNAGSLLALLAYPFVMEPLLTRAQQTGLWSAGMLGFALLCGACAIRVMGAVQGAAAGPEDSAEEDAPPPAWRDYALWLALPTVASVMLLAATNKLTQDVAVIPFLWVLPLGLYLLSFILCFESPRWYKPTAYGVALLVCIALYDTASADLVPTHAVIVAPILWVVLVHLAILFVVCMVCHGELYRLRPHPRHLTAFYLMVAVGGALGGVLVALVAPRVFLQYEEFELGVLACAVLGLLTRWLDQDSGMRRRESRWAWALVGLAYLGFGASLLGSTWARRGEIDHAVRNFYGALYVTERALGEVGIRSLWHGSTRHGIQLLDARRRLPTSYFAEETGVGLAMAEVARRDALHVGVVGLGVGTLAAYGRPGDRLRFYEINPRVVDVARRHFSYLAASAAEVEVVLGDARLVLEEEPAQGFDLLVLDAFSSDAIPVHLLTREAFDTYLRHLREDGLLAVHISNRHLDLLPVLRGLAEEHALALLPISNKATGERGWVFSSDWVLMARDPARLDAPTLREAASRQGEAVRSTGSVHWTDEYSSLLPVLR